jgi:hypothetical protein
MRQPSTADVAGIIQRFLEGASSDPWEWDDFLSVPLADPTLEAARRRCAAVRDEFPPPTADAYCGPGGEDVLRSLLKTLHDQ